jgi:hypothetical protein
VASGPFRRKLAAVVSRWGIALWLAAAGPANAVGIGTADTSSFIPFGGLSSELAAQLSDPTVFPRYQQVYSKDAFADPLIIRGLQFFEFDSPGGSGSALLGGTFTLYLSTTTKSVNGLDGNDLDSNLGSDNAVFAANVALTSVYSNGTLSFVGTPFFYDPSVGNLLVDMQVGGYDPDNAVADLVLGNRKFFQQTTDTIGEGDPLVSLVSNYDGLNNMSVGLVTDVIPIPEPSTYFLMSSGLLALGLLLKRRGAAR